MAPADGSMASPLKRQPHAYLPTVGWRWDHDDDEDSDDDDDDDDAHDDDDRCTTTKRRRRRTTTTTAALPRMQPSHAARAYSSIFCRWIECVSPSFFISFSE